MKKKFLILIVSLFIIIPFTAEAARDEVDSGSDNSSSQHCGNNCTYNWTSLNGDTGTINGVTKAVRAIRVTMFNQDAVRVSDSVDIPLNTGIKKSIRVKKNSSPTTKIEYIKGASLNWEWGDLNNLVELPSGVLEEIQQKFKDTNEINSIHDIATNYFADHHGFSTVPEVKNALHFCGDKYYSKCPADYDYYVVVEPVTIIQVSGINYYGTSYELTKAFPNPDVLYWKIYRDFQNFLYISGKFPDFYRNAGIWSKNGNYNLHDQRIGMEYTYDEIMHFGVGMAVIKWPYVDKDTEKELLTKLTCDINVNITECVESSISENNQKNCILNNPVYSMDACNLYCSDQIVTSFGGFYSSFIGNNAFGAIKSGRYLSIKSNPKITVNKTCYQTESSNECRDVIKALESKINDVKANKLYLTVDGRKYDFIGSSTISNIGYSDSDKEKIEATVIYEYKLDENVNKYINIETMKGILNPSSEGDKNTIEDKSYVNEGPTIITSKGSYGRYTYNFDVSETPINKYNVASQLIKRLGTQRSGNYQYSNNLNVTYTNTNDNQKDNYTLDDLKNNSCTYVKYNTDDGCIGMEDKCVDSVTCEVLDSCDVCECTGKYGCLDDGKCTPITDPKTDGDGKDVCDPEQKTCFPNLIYRPISLVEPFPGVDGKTRTPGNNWNKIYKTSDGRVYSYGDYYIRQRRGYKDYEIYQADPLYVIRLDGNKIQAIRTYNKTHNYNDFDLTCINGENCISNFLRGKANGFTINLIDSGTCKNITNHNFDSCIKNKGE